LRSKIDAEASVPRHLLTVRGAGYKFESSQCFRHRLRLCSSGAADRIVLSPGIPRPEQRVIGVALAGGPERRRRGFAMAGDSTDVVVVGGGIAGSALATALARDGFGVTVLERQTAYRDKVRGEALLCWGVAEMLRLDLEMTLLDAGGSYVTRAVPYDEIFEPGEAEVAARLLDQLLPGVPGALDVGHPEACEALIQAAGAAGATVIRGVGDVEIRAGSSPEVVYEHDDVAHEVSCRLIVGADGRMSTIRRQLGIELQQTTARTIGGGMLVEDLSKWPTRQISSGTEADLHYLVFPRAGARARLYLLHDIAQKGRFAGPNRQQEFLAAYQFQCIPDSEMFGVARPAGPCASTR
jgi:2-polyprenyl-6-methoxyphenol hydroxylase-like FAD-dependent oxidoreductase